MGENDTTTPGYSSIGTEQRGTEVHRVIASNTLLIVQSIVLAAVGIALVLFATEWNYLFLGGGCIGCAVFGVFLLWYKKGHPEVFGIIFYENGIGFPKACRTRKSKHIPFAPYSDITKVVKEKIQHSEFLTVELANIYQFRVGGSALREFLPKLQEQLGKAGRKWETLYSEQTR